MDKDDLKLTFFLNLGFALFEVLGGILTGSVLIYSLAIHSFGNTITMAISYWLEKYSKNQPDQKQTFGYKRFSVLGDFFTSGILVVCALWVFISAWVRIFKPVPIRISGMILFALLGFIINGYALFKTSKNITKNEKKIHSPLLWDTLKWIFVFIVALLIQIIQGYFIDPILSILIALGIGYQSCRTVFSSIQILTDATPRGIDLSKIEKELKSLKSIREIKEIHVWSLDGEELIMTLHIQTEKTLAKKSYEGLKTEIQEKIKEYGIYQSTIEFDYDENL